MANVADIEPLVIRGHDPAPLGRWLGRLGWLGFFTLAVFGWRAWKGDGVMRAPDPEINAFLQACWVLVPAVWGYTLSAAPIRCDAPPAEVLLPGQRGSPAGPGWWHLALFTPALVLGCVAVAGAAVELNRDLGAYALTPGQGAAVAAVTFVTAVLWGHNGFQPPRVWIGDRGVRFGFAHYATWSEIDHVQERANSVGLHLTASPALPFANLETTDPGAKALVERMVREHRLRAEPGAAGLEVAVKATVAVLVLAMIGGGVFAMREALAPPLAVVAVALAAGLGTTWLLERVRGISKITRQPKRVFDLKKTTGDAASEAKADAAPADGEIGRSAAGTRILRHTAQAGAAVGAGEDARGEWKEKRAAHYEEWLGKCETVWHELVPLEPHIDVHIHPPDRTRNRAFHTLITEGMSDARMKTPPGVGSDKSRIELLVYVPDFRVPEGGSNEMPFPLGVLKTLARLPFDYGTWLFVGHTIPNGDPPRPYVAGSELTTALLLPAISEPDGFTQGFDLDGDPVTFLSVVFLTAAETQLKLDKGLDALVDLWGDDIPWVLDLGRRSRV